jgi:hypothetical protein
MFDIDMVAQQCSTDRFAWIGFDDGTLGAQIFVGQDHYAGHSLTS